jgi:hypothetical protein
MDGWQPKNPSFYVGAEKPKQCILQLNFALSVSLRDYAIENAQLVPYIFCVDGFLVPHSTSEGAEVIFIFQILKNCCSRSLHSCSLSSCSLRRKSSLILIIRSICFLSLGICIIAEVSDQ